MNQTAERDRAIRNEKYYQTSKPALGGRVDNRQLPALAIRLRSAEHRVPTTPRVIFLALATEGANAENT